MWYEFIVNVLNYSKYSFKICNLLSTSNEMLLINSLDIRKIINSFFGSNFVPKDYQTFVPQNLNKNKKS